MAVANTPAAPGFFKFYNFTAANAGQIIKTGSGALQGVIINTGGAGTITLYDGVSTGGTKIGIINTAAQASLYYGVAFTTGLFAVVTGTEDITVTYT